MVRSAGWIRSSTIKEATIKCFQFVKLYCYSLHVILRITAHILLLCWNFTIIFLVRCAECVIESELEKRLPSLLRLRTSRKFGISSFCRWFTTHSHDVLCFLLPNVYGKRMEDAVTMPISLIAVHFFIILFSGFEWKNMKEKRFPSLLFSSIRDHSPYRFLEAYYTQHQVSPISLLFPNVVITPLSFLII